MVEIEWDGVELPVAVRRSLLDRLRTLACLVDPDGRARMTVEILSDHAGYCVVVEGHDELRRMGAEVRDAELLVAFQHALDLAISRWEAARQRAA